MRFGDGPPRAGVGQPHAVQLLQRLENAGQPHVPRVVVGVAHDVEPGAHQRVGGDRRGAEDETPGALERMPERRDGAFEVAEQHVRGAQRVRDGGERIEGVALEEVAVGQRPAEVQVPDGVEAQRVPRRPVARRRRRLQHTEAQQRSSKHCTNLGMVVNGVSTPPAIRPPPQGAGRGAKYRHCRRGIPRAR